jgi:hypothetical protein
VRAIGFLLLLSGWIIVLATLDLLTQFWLRTGFIASGIATEVIGLALLTHSYFSEQRSAK